MLPKAKMSWEVGSGDEMHIGIGKGTEDVSVAGNVLLDRSEAGIVDDLQV